jgi:predicted AAA+ superfamily ATPase
MKLRIQGNSIRLRLLRSEVARFVEEGRIAETVRFAPGDQAFFTYALEHEASAETVEVRYKSSEAIIVLPKSEALSWAQTEQVGIYAAVNIANHGDLSVSVEKDFACLDLSDDENKDTFPNPQVEVAC